MGNRKSKFSKLGLELRREFQEGQDQLHQLSLFALSRAEEGDLWPANTLVRDVSDSIFDIDHLVFWYELFGKLWWNNRENRFDYRSWGEWNVELAEAHPWYTLDDEGLDQGGEGTPRRIHAFLIPDEEAEIKELIAAYLERYPQDPSGIGKFGLPGDKNKWSAWRLKNRRKA